MLLEYKKALDLMLSQSFDLKSRKVALLDSLGYILSEDVFSDLNMPPFDKSAMDGYACRKIDLDNDLEVIEVIGAGYEPTKSIGENQCAKIMTGAKVPLGADTVIIKEDVDLINNKIRYNGKSKKSNICYVAEDYSIGDKLISKGTKIEARHIPVLAAVGKSDVEIYESLKVAVISTGDELVEVDQKPNSSQIRNTNAYQLIAQLKEMSIDAKYIGISKDNEQSTKEKVTEALKFADVIIASGAVSVGDFDFVPKVLEEEGFEFLFHGVNTKPGKRTLFGKKGNQWVIGVPGNPVSSYVQFEMLIKPFLYKLSKFDFSFKEYKIEITQDYFRKNSDRLNFQPVEIREGKVHLIAYNGSANINALVYANAMMLVEEGVNEYKKGELVSVRTI